MPRAKASMRQQNVQVQVLREVNPAEAAIVRKLWAKFARISNGSSIAQPHEDTVDNSDRGKANDQLVGHREE